jgi:hypothetical protein
MQRKLFSSDVFLCRLNGNSCFPLCTWNRFSLDCENRREYAVSYMTHTIPYKLEIKTNKSLGACEDLLSAMYAHIRATNQNVMQKNLQKHTFLNA